jgi:CubicO group peptidase (beta-lactamase class C family)|tara:strand:- start:450 stop:1625 length:1176 start_codon:yes stop_codon:yes gene_type:complete
MKYNFLFILLIVIGTSGCGGGGGSSSSSGSGSGSGGATNAPAPATLQLDPTWTLQSADPTELNLNTSDVDAILNHIFTDQAVQSALLVRNGWVIGERFSPGVDINTLGTSWSVAKSFYAALIGIALEEGWLTGLDQPASEFLSEWVGGDKEAITIRDILEMRAGYGADSGIYDETDQSTFAIDFPKTREQGTTFEYSNPTSQLLEPIILRSTGMDAHAYLAEKILLPIGIDPNLIGMWLDRTGTNPLTYMGLDMTPLDMARFGLLYARNGEWDGNQIVPANYVQASLSAQTEYYGLQWWVLNGPFFGQEPPITISAALGLNGQKIYVWPAEDLVLVVQTQYEHSANQGYVLSNSNFPNTCTARNACPNSTGAEVASYNQFALMSLLAELVD